MSRVLGWGGAGVVSLAMWYGLLHGFIALYRWLDIP